MTLSLLSIPGPSFEDILATGHVLRWHTKPMAQPQTLADHLCKVALLAHRLGKHLGERFDIGMAFEVLALSLYHDLPETEHGDIPNPAKRFLDERMMGPLGYDDQVALDWWAARGFTHLQAEGLVLSLVRVADVLEAAARYWTYGLDGDLRTRMVFEAFAATRKILPELLPVVAEALAAAGVHQALIDEAAA